MSNLDQSIGQLKIAIVAKEGEIRAAEFAKAQAEVTAAHHAGVIANLERDIFELEKGVAVLEHAEKNVVSTT